MRIGSNSGLDFASSVFNRANSTSRLQKDIEKLSTGKRINRAADDAAGLSISQKLTSKIRGNNQAKRNIGDGISMLQTIEGSLSSINDQMQRIRELKVQAENGTNSVNELNAMQLEINTIMESIDDTARGTEFNGRRLIYATYTNDYNIRLQTGADQDTFNTLRLRAGPASIPNGTGVEVQISDGNTANAGELNDDLPGVRFEAFHLDGASVNSYYSTRTNNNTSRNTVIDLDQMDTFLSNISRMRTFIGSEQNRLESKLDYLDVAVENQMAAKQRIEDTDVAKVSSNFIKHQIQQQSAVMMLSQAQNIQKDIILGLLP